MEQVGQAGQQVLLASGLAAVCQDLLPERTAEVQSLQHRVTVAGVPKLEKRREGGDKTKGEEGEVEV